jgi:hypothetical protein
MPYIRGMDSSSYSNQSAIHLSMDVSAFPFSISAPSPPAMTDYSSIIFDAEFIRYKAMAEAEDVRYEAERDRDHLLQLAEIDSAIILQKAEEKSRSMISSAEAKVQRIEELAVERVAGMQRQMERDTGYFTVEKIIDKRIGETDGKVEYCVVWLGYTEEDYTWETKDCLSGCQEMIDEYENSTVIYLE